MTKQPLPNNLPPISEMGVVTIDKDLILTRTMAHPALAPKRKPTIEQACKVAVSEVEMTFIEQVTACMEPQLEELVGAYKLNGGEREDHENPDEWDSGLDDQFENLLEPWQAWLSANWLGVNTIDSGLHEDNATSKMATKIAREVWKQTVSGRTINQQLSSAGITQPDVEVYFEQHLAAQPQQQEAEVLQENKDELHGVLVKIKLAIGDGFDQMEVFGDLELALDDDEILAAGAAPRLGLDADDLPTLALALHDNAKAEDAAQALVEQLVELDVSAGPAPAEVEEATPATRTPPPPPPRPSGATPPPPPPRPGAAKATAAPKAAPKAKTNGGEANHLNNVLSLFKSTPKGDFAAWYCPGEALPTMAVCLKATCSLVGTKRALAAIASSPTLAGLNEALKPYTRDPLRDPELVKVWAPHADEIRKLAD